ncbi:kinase-like protein [Annulohypoxylon truncatum]|uniref:kinase-like protein n=1 Tax=Annulohypoxylon truncatum TaxID=327061 RepID=UPI0020084F20|nr:kinase-like protein [Annulohypoxylon truncatum]KAI1206261.1 kinase-like protein [Annulohypoxylon truncatum]
MSSLQDKELPSKIMTDEDRKFFGPLLDISATSLVALGSRVYEHVFHKQSEKGELIARIAGSYNLVHVIQLDDDFKLVIRVPATGWGSGKTETAAHALESTVATMRFVAKNTSIPVPQVYDFDTTDNNEIQAPYMCISFVSGMPVSQVWFKEPEDMSREELRLNILRNLAQVMAKFSSFSFDKIGSIQSDESTLQSLAPCYDWHLNEDGTLQVVSSGPFDSVSDYLAHHFKEDKDDEYGKGGTELLKAIMPISITDGSSQDFVLRPPDFDSQNVMVDDLGNITGLIDWDLAQTVPRLVGYAKYPSWLTRDWDPLMYAWPEMLEEDSPATLKAWRGKYRDFLGDALDRQGDWKFTLSSHLTEAVWIAAHHIPNRVEICRKLVEEATDGDDADGLSTLFQIGDDYFEEEDWNVLNDGIKRLFLSQDR